MELGDIFRVSDQGLLGNLSLGHEGEYPPLREGVNAWVPSHLFDAITYVYHSTTSPTHTIALAAECHNVSMELRLPQQPTPSIW